MGLLEAAGLMVLGGFMWNQYKTQQYRENMQKRMEADKRRPVIENYRDMDQEGRKQFIKHADDLMKAMIEHIADITTFDDVATRYEKAHNERIETLKHRLHSEADKLTEQELAELYDHYHDRV